MLEIQLLLDGCSTDAIGKILGCSGNSVRSCIRGKTLTELETTALDRINAILDAKEAGRREQEAPMSFEIVERRIEIRAGEGTVMRAESRNNTFVIDITAETEG